MQMLRKRIDAIIEAKATAEQIKELIKDLTTLTEKISSKKLEAEKIKGGILKMYSDTIKSKIDKMFSDLRDEVQESIDESFPSNDMVNIVCGRVRSEMESRSKTMLSDMLFELNDSVLQTSFFADNMAGQNTFLTHNLRQEVLTKYQFSTTSTINYQETSLVVGSVKVGGES